MPPKLCSFEVCVNRIGRSSRQGVSVSLSRLHGILDGEDVGPLRPSIAVLVEVNRVVLLFRVPGHLQAGRQTLHITTEKQK